MAERQLPDGGWVCSAYGSWLPGLYESQRACRLAYRVPMDRLAALWDGKRGPDGIVRDVTVLMEAELRIARRVGGD